MWPWGHLAAGYLLYVGWRHYTEPAASSFTPSLTLLILLAIGTQFPDFVDKPLAWTVNILPTGRTLAHSALVAIPISIGVGRLLDTEQGYAFAIGYLSHLAADAVWPVAEGQFGYLAFLLWPVLPSPSYEVAPSFGAHLTTLRLTPNIAAEIALFGIAFVHWMYVGRPGLSPLLKAVSNVFTTSA